MPESIMQISQCLLMHLPMEALVIGHDGILAGEHVLMLLQHGLLLPQNALVNGPVLGENRLVIGHPERASGFEKKLSDSGVMGCSKKNLCVVL